MRAAVKRVQLAGRDLIVRDVLKGQTLTVQKEFEWNRY